MKSEKPFIKLFKLFILLFIYFSSLNGMMNQQKVILTTYSNDAKTEKSPVKKIHLDEAYIEKVSNPGINTLRALCRNQLYRNLQNLDFETKNEIIDYLPTEVQEFLFPQEEMKALFQYLSLDESARENYIKCFARNTRKKILGITSSNEKCFTFHAPRNSQDYNFSACNCAEFIKNKNYIVVPDSFLIKILDPNRECDYCKYVDLYLQREPDENPVIEEENYSKFRDEISKRNCSHYIEFLEGHTNSVENIKCSSNGKYIISCAYDNTIKIWDLEKECEHCNIIKMDLHINKKPSKEYFDNKEIEKNCSKCILTLEGHSEKVTSVDLSPCEKFIVSTSDDNTIKIWYIDLENKTYICTSTLENNEKIIQVKFSPDGNYIFEFDNRTIKARDFFPLFRRINPLFQGAPVKKNIYKKQFGTSGHMDISSDSKHVLIEDGNKIILYDITTDTLKAFNLPFSRARFSPDAEYIALVDNKKIRIWSLKHSKFIFNLEGHEEDIQIINFSPCGRYLISLSQDSQIKIWDLWKYMHEYLVQNYKPEDTL